MTRHSQFRFILTVFMCAVVMVCAVSSLAEDPPPLTAPTLEMDGVARSIVDLPLALPVSGVVVKVNAETGAFVNEGAVLIILDHEALLHQAEQARLRSQDESREHQEDLEIKRLQGILEETDNDDTRSSLELEVDLATARRNHATVQREIARSRYLELQDRIAQHHLRVRSTGIVDELWISPGQFIKAGEPVGRLICVDRLVIDLGVPSDQAAMLSKGAAVQIVRRGTPWDVSEPVAATITAVSPAIDPQTDTRRVSLVLDNARNWPAGTFITVRFAPPPVNDPEAPLAAQSAKPAETGTTQGITPETSTNVPISEPEASETPDSTPADAQSTPQEATSEVAPESSPESADEAAETVQADS